MKIILNILLSLILTFSLSSCSSSKKKNSEDSDINKSLPTEKIKNVSLFNEDTKPFYTVDPKLEEIESEIALLKEQVIQVSISSCYSITATEVLKLLKNPGAKHEIQLSNGTTIQGVIIYENVDQLIVETQIGQLQINKDEVISTEDILPPLANLEFVGDAIEEVYQSKEHIKVL